MFVILTMTNPRRTANRGHNQMSNVSDPCMQPSNAIDVATLHHGNGNPNPLVHAPNPSIHASILQENLISLVQSNPLANKSSLNFVDSIEPTTLNLASKFDDALTLNLANCFARRVCIKDNDGTDTNGPSDKVNDRPVGGTQGTQCISA